MSLEQRAELILAFAKILYVNGQSTDQTLIVAEQLAHTLGLRAKILPRWGELQLQVEDGAARLISVIAAEPAGVGSCGFDNAGNRGRQHRTACAKRRKGDDQHDRADASCADVALHARGRCWRRGSGGDLRRSTSTRGRAHIP